MAPSLKKTTTTYDQDSHNQGNIIFQNKITIFPGQRIQELGVINEDKCEKAY